MNNLKGYVLATLGVVSLVASLTINIVRANSGLDAQTVTSSTAHFNLDKTYLLNPANGTGKIKCKVTKIDGSWLRCEGENPEWVNVDTMMSATDFK